MAPSPLLLFLNKAPTNLTVSPSSSCSKGNIHVRTHDAVSEAYILPDVMPVVSMGLATETHPYGAAMKKGTSYVEHTETGERHSCKMLQHVPVVAAAQDAGGNAMPGPSAGSSNDPVTLPIPLVLPDASGNAQHIETTVITKQTNT